MSMSVEFSLKPIRKHEGKKIDNTMYTQIVGNLMYLTTTSPNIMHVISLVSKYMEYPRKIDLLATKIIFRYLQGTIDFGLFYKKGKNSNLIGFIDSDYVADLEN